MLEQYSVDMAFDVWGKQRKMPSEPMINADPHILYNSSSF